MFYIAKQSLEIALAKVTVSIYAKTSARKTINLAIANIKIAPHMKFPQTAIIGNDILHSSF